MSRTALLACVCTVSCSPGPLGGDFLAGASMAGFQVDPGCPTLPAEVCEDRRSDWYQWVTARDRLGALAPIMSFQPVADGPGFFELYRADLDLAATELKLNAVRVSIEWSRIFPQPTDGVADLSTVASPAGVAHYRDLFRAMSERRLTPLVTLNHYTLPVWIHDGVACHEDLATCPARGWLDEARTVREIARYAGFVAATFGDQVDLWATLNEPFAVVLPGYLQPSADRVNPPGVSFRFAEAKLVMRSMLRAHAAMYDAVKAADRVDADGRDGPSAVGLVYSVTPVRGENPASRVDSRAAENVFYLYNTAFLDGAAKGELDLDLDGEKDAPAPDPAHAGRMDWLGLNYYTRLTIRGLGEPAFPALSPLTTFDPTSASPWEDFAPGMYDMLMWLTGRYGVPVYVTETGADAAVDPERPASWVARYATMVERARVDGADVRGFFVWSLMDNYEWNHGMAWKLGLYAVGETVDRPRTARSAVGVYRSIIEAGRVPQALKERYPVQ